MDVELASVTPLRFDDGAPVRAASAIAAAGAGWLVVQDDATHACWWRDGRGTPVRLLPPVEGHDLFDEGSGTKPLKPDLEAALEVEVDGDRGVLVLGSGSTPARMRSVLLVGTEWRHQVAELAPVYAVVAAALGLDPDQLNLEGACVVGERVRWFHRGLPSAGVPTASVDLGLADLLRVAAGGDPSSLEVAGARRYDLGSVAGIGLAVTDCVGVGGGAVLVSAAAEDSPTTYDDGPVVGSALALLDGEDVLAVTELPPVEGRVAKVEGLAVVAADGETADVVAVVDADDPGVPSTLLGLRVAW